MRRASASGVPPGSRVITTFDATCPQCVRDDLDLRALPGAVDALEGDETAALLHLPMPRWYLSTARLCSSSELEKCDEPSPRATKYSASVAAGRSAASIEARPGSAMGVGGSPATRVGIVRAVGQEIALAQVAIEPLAEPVDDRRVRLQQHAAPQSVDKHACDQRALGRLPGFFLDDRGHDQRFIRRLVRKLRIACVPRLLQYGHLGTIRLAPDVEVTAAGVIEIRLGREQALRVRLDGTDRLQQLGGRELRAVLPQVCSRGELRAQFTKRRAFDDRQPLVDDVARPAAWRAVRPASFRARPRSARTAGSGPTP